MGAKKLVVGLVAITALTFTALGAGSASAAEFVASKTGSLKGSADTSQKFEVSSGSGEYVLCDKLSVTGTVTTLKAGKQAAVVQYEECKAVTFLGELSAEISAADYTFNANGSVEITKPIVINIGGGLATQTVTDQTASSVTYSNSSPVSTIMINASIMGIHSEGALGTQTTGTYTGESLTALEGGTIEWVAGKVLFELANPGGALKNPPKVGEERTIEVINVGTAAGTPTGLAEAATRVGFFEVSEAEVETCRKMLYAIGAKCSFKVKVSKVTTPEEAIVKWEAVVNPGNANNKVSLSV